jgi:demethylmenaquinone methyltransferase/2-methoxy-6-polyprenyl-1,4-benzoquinol methylase
VGSLGRFAQDLFTGVAWGYDRVAWWLSYGQYPRWHRFLVSCVPPEAETVLDVATGTGAVALLLARRGHRVVALDLTEAMLRQAVRRLRASAVGGRVGVVRADARRLPFPDATFDALTFTFLLRYVEDPPAVVRELGRVVRPGGQMASLEFGLPDLPWRWGWWLHARLVLPVGGRLASDGWAHVGRFLGPSIEAFCRAHPFAEVRSWWEAAGFVEVQRRRLSLGAAEVVWGRKA